MTDSDPGSENEKPPSSEVTANADIGQRFVVLPAHAGKRLDALLAEVFPEHSRARLRKLINAAEVRLNGRRQKAAFRVHAGDVITLSSLPDSPVGPEPENIPLDVVYEDDRFVVVNKPARMVVHPSKGHWSGTLTAALSFRFRQLSQAGGPTRPGIVHRLDRDTSGVIVVAKDDAAHLNLSGQFERREVKKEYFAICRGPLDRDRDWIDQPIAPHAYQREKMAIRPRHPAARSAQTFFEVQTRAHGFVALKAFPKTGRTHQIRVHLAHIGCPVICDPLYSGHRVVTRGELLGGSPDEDIVIDRLALHARRIQFRHPDHGRQMEFQAPLPLALRRVLDLLGE